MGRRRGNDHVVLTAVALGTIAGLRSMAAPALLTHELSAHSRRKDRSTLEKLITSDGVARVMALLAGGEMLADKSPDMPNRTDAVPLAGRALLGSLSAAAFASHKKQSIALPAAVGAISAVASTFASFHLRRLASEHYKVPDQVFGLVEDAIVMAASKGVAQALEAQL
jgi:uncharacterized membrane protein